jgi:hypothetical protein
MGTERMLIILEESTDPPADHAIVARDIEGTEHELTVVPRAGMVCIQDQEQQDSAYIMHAAAALQLGLQLIRTCITIRAASRQSPARPGRSPHEGTH